MARIVSGDSTKMKTGIKLVIAGSLGLTIVGCNVGSVPRGMSQDDAKARIANMKPEDQIRFYNSSPMPQAEKEKKFKEIEEKTGVKAADVLKGQPSLPTSH